MKYAIRILTNDSLEPDIAELLIIEIPDKMQIVPHRSSGAAP